jgi:hypothetical protein
MATAIGLAGYAIWRVLQALLDLEHKVDRPKKDLAVRSPHGG